MDITPVELDRIHEAALRDLAADENAQRCYRVATMQDLLSWLAPVPNEHPLLDTWTVNRRVDLMRRSLAAKQAALCADIRHDVFENEQGEDVAGHAAEHLRKLRGQ